MSIVRPAYSRIGQLGQSRNWVIESEGAGTGWKREGGVFATELAAKKRLNKLRFRYHWTGKNFRIRDLSVPLPSVAGQLEGDGLDDG